VDVEALGEPVESELLSELARTVLIRDEALLTVGLTSGTVLIHDTGTTHSSSSSVAAPE